MTPNSSHPSRRPTAHAAEGIRQRCREHRNGQHLEQVRQGCRVLIGMCPIGVKEAAAIGAQVLDELQRGHRPLRNDLLRHLDRVHDGLPLGSVTGLPLLSVLGC